MIALTLRQRNIIEYLLSRDSYVTNDVIASNFEVSNRNFCLLKRTRNLFGSKAW